MVNRMVELGDAKLFYMIDENSDYWRIEVREDDRKRKECSLDKDA